MPPPTPRELALALNASPSVPRAAACLLAGCLDEWMEAAEADSSRLSRRLGVSPRTLAAALALRERAAELAGRETAAATREGARTLVRGDADYPESLLHLSLPPPALYCLGELPAGPAVAIVGSRRAESWALEAARWLGHELAAAGVLVVSGLALGVDAAAHRGALAANGGRTVAVLGCGLAIDYPRGHRALAREIAASGAVVSEFPPHTPPEPWRFPVRNRLIAALAAGVVVVSAVPRSGSLVTARLALELGREVMALPARIFDETGLGTNALLRDGATLVRHPDDVLQALGLDRPAAASAPRPRRDGEPDGPANPLVALLAAGGPVELDALAAAAGRPVDELLGELLELELSGRVRRLPGPRFEVLR